MTAKDIENFLVVRYYVAPEDARMIRDRLEAGELASVQARELFELNQELKKQLGIKPKTWQPRDTMKTESSIEWNETNAKSLKD